MRKVIAIFVVLALLLLSSCKGHEIIVEKPVVVEHTTETHHVDIVRDTLIMRDSSVTLIKGDTVLIEKWHHVSGVRKMIIADTVRDTVPQVVTVTKTEVKEVEKPLGWWQKTLMWCGGIGLLLIALYAILKTKIRFQR